MLHVDTIPAPAVQPFTQGQIGPTPCNLDHHPSWAETGVTSSPATFTPQATTGLLQSGFCDTKVRSWPRLGSWNSDDGLLRSASYQREQHKLMPRTTFGHNDAYGETDQHRRRMPCSPNGFLTAGGLLHPTESGLPSRVMSLNRRERLLRIDAAGQSSVQEATSPLTLDASPPKHVGSGTRWTHLLSQTDAARISSDRSFSASKSRFSVTSHFECCTPEHLYATFNKGALDQTIEPPFALSSEECDTKALNSPVESLALYRDVSSTTLFAKTLRLHLASVLWILPQTLELTRGEVILGNATRGTFRAGGSLTGAPDGWVCRLNTVVLMPYALEPQLRFSFRSAVGPSQNAMTTASGGVSLTTMLKERRHDICGRIPVFRPGIRQPCGYVEATVELNDGFFPALWMSYDNFAQKRSTLRRCGSVEPAPAFQALGRVFQSLLVTLTVRCDRINTSAQCVPASKTVPLENITLKVSLGTSFALKLRLGPHGFASTEETAYVCAFPYSGESFLRLVARMLSSNDASVSRLPSPEWHQDKPTVLLPLGTRRIDLAQATAFLNSQLSTKQSLTIIMDEPLVVPIPGRETDVFTIFIKLHFQRAPVSYPELRNVHCGAPTLAAPTQKNNLSLHETGTENAFYKHGDALQTSNSSLPLEPINPTKQTTGLNGASFFKGRAAGLTSLSYNANLSPNSNQGCDSSVIVPTEDNESNMLAEGEELSHRPESLLEVASSEQLRHQPDNEEQQTLQPIDHTEQNTPLSQNLQAIQKTLCVYLDTAILLLPKHASCTEDDPAVLPSSPPYPVLLTSTTLPVDSAKDQCVTEHFDMTLNPYVVLRVGSATIRTKAIKQTHAPRFHTLGVFPQAAAESFVECLQRLRIELYSRSLDSQVAPKPRPRPLAVTQTSMAGPLSFSEFQPLCRDTLAFCGPTQPSIIVLNPSAYGKGGLVPVVIPLFCPITHAHCGEVRIVCFVEETAPPPTVSDTPPALPSSKRLEKGDRGRFSVALRDTRQAIEYWRLKHQALPDAVLCSTLQSRRRHPSKTSSVEGVENDGLMCRSLGLTLRLEPSFFDGVQKPCVEVKLGQHGVRSYPRYQNDGMESHGEENAGHDNTPPFAKTILKVELTLPYVARCPIFFRYIDESRPSGAQCVAVSMIPPCSLEDKLNSVVSFAPATHSERLESVPMRNGSKHTTSTSQPEANPTWSSTSRFSPVSMATSQISLPSGRVDDLHSAAFIVPLQLDFLSLPGHLVPIDLTQSTDGVSTLVPDPEDHQPFTWRSMTMDTDLELKWIQLTSGAPFVTAS